MCDNTTEAINLNAEMHKMHKKCRKVKKKTTLNYLDTAVWHTNSSRNSFKIRIHNTRV